MKKNIISLFAILIVAASACNKEKKIEPISDPQTSANTDNYSTLADFYQKNGVTMETFTFNAGNGATYVSAKGTSVIIPANTFTPSNAEIKIEFKDIYKKSDMLLSKMPTITNTGWPLKSAGEFFIRALNNNVPIAISNTILGISVRQPTIEPIVKEEMLAYFGSTGLDSTNNFSWTTATTGNVSLGATGYIFSLYQFSQPMSNGSWCNSDTPGYFGSYPQTTLTLHPIQDLPDKQVFLVFKTVNCMVTVARYPSINYVYNYAPKGLECTVVAIAVKDGKLQSSFTPITIGVNQTFDFGFNETTTENFKAALNALNQ